MRPKPETFGRWLFEVVVTLGLVFGGFAAAGAAQELIAPRVGFVYSIALVIALVPAGLWLQRCGVVAVPSRARFASVVVLVVVIMVVIDFMQPQPGADWTKLLMMGGFALQPWIEWIFERTPGLRSRTELADESAAPSAD